MGGVILVSEGVGCNFWPREGCKNEVPAMGTPLLPPLCPPVIITTIGTLCQYYDSITLFQ